MRTQCRATAYPIKDTRAETGSNVPENALLMHRAQLTREHEEPLQKITADYKRKAKSLFTAADARVASKLAHEVKADFYMKSLATIGDYQSVTDLKNAALKDLDRQLGKVLPNYRELKSLSRQFGKAHEKVVKTTMAGPPVGEIGLHWKDFPVLAALDTYDFIDPYPIFDVHTVDPNHLIVKDDSFVLPDSGTLVNNIVFDHDQHESWTTAAITDPDCHNVRSIVSCGVRFTMPRGGRLRITATLQNAYNKVMLSLRDNFGFSSASLLFDLNLFIDVIRPPGVTHLPTTLYGNGYIAPGGTDVDRSFVGIDNAEPYIYSVETGEFWPEGDIMWVVVGSEVNISSYLNDMHGHINAVVWWQLKKLTIEVLDFIIL